MTVGDLIIKLRDALGHISFILLFRSCLISLSFVCSFCRIGFLGLGLMGSGIVSNLLKMGHVVTVWNRTAEKVPLIPLTRRFLLFKINWT